MKKIFLLIMCMPLLVIAQPITISSPVDFGVVTTGVEESAVMTITNTSGYDITVTGIEFFEYYQIYPFYTNENSFTLGAGQAKDVTIHVKAEQNMLHQMQIVIKTDFRGDYILPITAEAHFNNAYYASTYNKSEESLKSSLKSRLSQGYVSLGYNTARDNMYSSIDNVNGDVECVYTGRVATFNSRPGANNNSFNCEHTFPQGFFNKNDPMKSDIHHLFPTDVGANSQRGNLPFGVVSGNPSWSQGGSKKSSSKFEPRNLHKGDVARAMMYFVLRYQDYSNHFSGQETILRQWHALDSVSSKEIQRNNDIFALQKNRSPFVDFPQLIKRINKIVGNSVAPSNPSLYVSRDSVDMRFKTDSMTYSISVVNNGNKEVTLTNFRIDDSTAFVFANAQSDRILLPNEGFELKVRTKAIANLTVSDVVRFNTDIPSKPEVTIGFKGEWDSFVSVQEESTLSPFLIAPNPAKDFINIKWDANESFTLDVIDLTGKSVIHLEHLRGQKKLRLDQIASGVYTVRCFSKTKSRFTKLVKE